MGEVNNTLLRKIAWDRQKRDTARITNEMILDRIRGVPAQPGTPETDAEHQNPNTRVQG